MIENRLALLPLILTLAVYPPLAFLALQHSRRTQRAGLFGWLNLLGAFAATAATVAVHVPYTWAAELRMLVAVAIAFAFYVGLVCLNYTFIQRNRGARWAAVAVVLFPLSMLILLKYVPGLQTLFADPLKPIKVSHISVLFLGLSYVSFRLIHLSQEVRNEVAPMPTLMEYLGFAFFVPTLSSGPISWYSVYHRSLQSPDRSRTPLLRSVVRILVGLTKFIFLAALVNQLTYAGLLRDGHPHHKIDLLVAIFAYTAYLYCNFSGFCDMAIGLAGVLGIEIMENFNQPFHARNFQEFWNRWHITLSIWMRDLVFTPLVKMLVRFFGPQSTNNVIAASILVAFLLIGAWHGFGINFALFGLSQGLGVMVVHYYTLFLKKRLGKKGFARYRDNHLIRYASTALTIVYFSVSLALFANTWEQLQQIFKVLV